jgi:dolichol-phosphate mannosyltransferase
MEEQNLKNKDSFLLSVVVPAYNESKNIPILLGRLKKLFVDSNIKYEIIFCLDPSTDNSAEIISKAAQEDSSIKLLHFSRRFGQPAATMAGIHYMNGDAGVVIDADLQDPPELIIDMIEKWKEGFEVVYAQRTSRDGETLIKRVVSWLGYWLINKITNVKIPRNTGDFRLLDRVVIDELKKLDDQDGFLRGLVAYVGFSQAAIPYKRHSRIEGQGNYNRYLGSLKIGLNGIIGFSRYPLHVISIVGLLISIASFLIGLTYIIARIFHIEITWGNPTLVILLSFYSGVQLLSLGIMGQYVARIYDTTLKRPQFIVKDKIGFGDN